MALEPLSLRDEPCLIEKLLPVQKLSVESYKEQMAVHGKTLTALGSYWKGRKPLILNKACVLGALLPVSDDAVKDLETFELLMGMDDAALHRRLVAKGALKKDDPLPEKPYKDLVGDAKRPEEIGDALFVGVWDRVNAHLGTAAKSFPELVEQLGVARYGRRPVVADTFCGSGQIPFAAARLGCDVVASDLNPIACMLTWGAMHVVGGSKADRVKLKNEQEKLAEKVQAFVDDLGVERETRDGQEWRGKVYLYCLEARCPETGWMVPMLPTLQVSKGYKVVAELIPDPDNKRYDIDIVSDVDAATMAAAVKGTVDAGDLVHTVDGVEHRTSIKTLRGDFKKDGGGNANALRMWEVGDYKPRPDDLYQERLYAVQWQQLGVSRGKAPFRAVTEADLTREAKVEAFLDEHLAEWQEKGWIPDMRIEPGYNTNQPIRERGWTHWHHLFNPRQLLLAGFLRQHLKPETCSLMCQCLNWNSRMSHWSNGDGGGGAVKQTFYNQALNTFWNHGCRGTGYLNSFIKQSYKRFEVVSETKVVSQAADQPAESVNVFVTDPPYGDAVKYEEILEYFIAWLRKNPPKEFADWTWDSRRALSIRGEDEGFRQGMVAAYKRMAECMSPGGTQVVMFTHQSTRIWADMANIVWASGLRVSAAWYVVTETDSALRTGANVKGTVLLVLKKRDGHEEISRTELGLDLADEVAEQVRTLTGLNQEAKTLYRDENLFHEADLQMAGYAAALRVLTRYAVVDGRDMTVEAIRPREGKAKTFVDELIDYAVGEANKYLVPVGLDAGVWAKLRPVERFYLKMLAMEAGGDTTLEKFQNFAKAFKVADWNAMLASSRANKATVKLAAGFGKSDMAEGSPWAGTPVRGVLYALWEMGKTDDTDTHAVLGRLATHVPDARSSEVSERLATLAGWLSETLEGLSPEDASHARVLREAIRTQRL